MGSDNMEWEGDKRKQLALSFSRTHPQTHHGPAGTKQERREGIRGVITVDTRQDKEQKRKEGEAQRKIA